MVKWDPVKNNPRHVVVEIEGKPVGREAWEYDSADQVLTVQYVHHTPTVHISVRPE
jgi:sulfur carrier protein ThiS